MSVDDAIDEWDRSGELDDIRDKFSSIASAISVPPEISEQRKLTTDQIQYCFDAIFSSALVSYRGYQLPEIIQEFREMMSSEEFPEFLCNIASTQNTSIDELMDDIIREHENDEWNQSS